MIEADDTNSNPKSGLVRQIICSVIVSIVSLNSGMGQGWLSPMSLKLKAEDSPVETMSKEDLSYLATYPLYAGFIAAPIVSFLGKQIGRKSALFAVLVPNMLSGLVMTFAPSKVWLYVGRTIGAFRIGGINLAEMYISEIAHESVRGMLMAFCTVQINVGILLSYSLGKSLSYKAFNSVFTAVPFVCTVLLFWIPESPHFLVEKNRKDNAKKAMLWLKNGDRTAADLELEVIKPSEKGHDGKVSLKQVWNDKPSRAALSIGVLSFALQTLSGIHSILNYAGLIFEESSSFLSPDDSSIVTAVLLLIASVINVILIDRYGRKPLLYVSFIGSAISLSVLSVFLYALMKGMDVGNLGSVPVISVSAFVFLYGIGLAAVPGALASEVSPTNIRPAMGGVVTVVALIILIGVLQSFPFLDEHVGLYFVFVIPTFFNVLGVFFTRFMVLETKGKSLVDISNELRAR